MACPVHTSARRRSCEGGGLAALKQGPRSASLTAVPLDRRQASMSRETSFATPTAAAAAGRRTSCDSKSSPIPAAATVQYHLILFLFSVFISLYIFLNFFTLLFLDFFFFSNLSSRARAWFVTAAAESAAGSSRPGWGRGAGGGRGVAEG